MAIKRGTLDRVGKPNRYQIAGAAERVPVRIRGVDYPSMKYAARCLGITHAAISRALDAGKIDEVGLNYHAPEPTEFAGETYPSRRKADAARIHFDRRLRAARRQEKVMRSAEYRLSVIHTKTEHLIDQHYREAVKINDKVIADRTDYAAFFRGVFMTDALYSKLEDLRKLRFFGTRNNL